MTASSTAFKPLPILAAALFWLGWELSRTHADDKNPEQHIQFRKMPAVAMPTVMQGVDGKEEADSFVAPQKAKKTADDDAAEAGKDADLKAQKGAGPKKGEKAGAKDGAPAGKKFDPAVVSAGKAAFDRGCTTCHDAARSLERTKDLPGWRATVRRMAARRGADIATSDIEPISVYLTSRNASSAEASADKDKNGNGPSDASAGTKPAVSSSSPESDASSISAFATLSPQWRGGKNDLQNPGFGPLAWVGGNWQSQFVSARVTVCMTCHGVQEQAYPSRIDLVEAAVRVDLSDFLGKCSRGLKGGIDAGRFIVPFGAFSAQTNPGLYRTVSTPLIFNMGQRIHNRDLGDSVLPMPYTDTGVNFSFDIPLGDLGTGLITASTDSYLVNGLVGNGNGIDFLQSRNLFDNNNHAVGGGRITLGDPYIRAGASVVGGRFDDPKDASIVNGPLHYTIYGFDIQARYKKLFRCQFEYARRDNDRTGGLANGPGIFTESVDGHYLEAEIRPWDECRVSFLARHDFQRRISDLPPPASSLTTGRFNVERITFGVNFELWHQSLLMFNIERWLVPEPQREVNVFGVRYTVTF